MYTELIQQFMVELGPNLSKEQEFALIIHAYMIKNNFIEQANQLTQIKLKAGPFKLSYKKDNLSYSITITPKSDNKFDFILLNPNRKATVVIDKEKHLKNIQTLSEINEKSIEPFDTFLNSIVNTNYTSPLMFQQPPEPRQPINQINPLNSVHVGEPFVPNSHFPFPPNSQIPFPYQPFPIGGNLVGPDNLLFSQRQPNVKYDPITPFGMGFDFYPPQDGFGPNGPGFI